MRTRLSYRSGNPALNKNTFKNLSRTSTNPLVADQSMTIKGTVDKTAISLFLLIVAGYYSYSINSPILLIGGALAGFITAIITIFNKKVAPVTAPLYAIFEGLALGGISFMYAQQYEGIVLNAVSLTALILLSLLMAYRSGLIKPSENFKLGVVAATGGIFLVYLVSLIGSFFGMDLSILNPTNGSMFSIIFSLVVILIASLNLVLDFDFIEEASENGAPKYMEWYAAFGLMVTLVWLYLEILRLLAKINSRD